MSRTKFSKFYKIFINIIFIINELTSAIEDKHNESMTWANINDYYEHLSYVDRRYRRQITNTNERCKIPNYLNSAYQIISDSGTTYKPGDYVNKYSILKITCDEGYKLPPFAPNSFHCFDGQWNDTPPACLRVCSSLMSTTSMTVRCEYNETLLNNCVNPVQGTTVHLSCNKFYEPDEGINRNPTRSCSQHGTWTPNLPQCYATCGSKSPGGNFHLFNGGTATPGNYPWHVGIYDASTKEFRCSGTIIDRNIILTAAHCVTNDDGNLYPPEEFLIGAGKYFRKFDDERDIFGQYSNVFEIHVPKDYKGIDGLYGLDIAVVILNNLLMLTDSVLPVCIALNVPESENGKYLLNKETVSSWGYTQIYRESSDVLYELIIPYVSNEKCYNQVQDSFRDFVTYDKICTSNPNQESSICQGNSGGGLFQNLHGHYYIVGIASKSVMTQSGNDTHCDGLYTSVMSYFKFVRTLVTNYGWVESIECQRQDCTYYEEFVESDEVISTDCRLPNFPQHGTYSLPIQDSEYKPGNYVPIYNSIILNCDKGYKANSSGAAIYTCLGERNWKPALGSCTPEAINQTISKGSPSFNTTQDEEYKLSSRFNDFDLELLQIYQKNDINYVTSPAQIKVTLAMLLEGSKGKTAQEISQVLGIPVDVNSAREILNDLQQDLRIEPESIILKKVISLLVPDNYTMRPEYSNILQEHYDDVNSASSLTNSYYPSDLSNQIRDAENNIIYENSLIIINALSFEPQWKIKFNEVTGDFVTKTDSSILSGGAETLQVQSQFRYRFVEELNAQAVELPYSEEEYAMLILFPKEENKVDDLQRDLQRISFATIIDSLVMTEVFVSLPSFVITYRTELKPTLKRMGIKELFSENANLSGIIEQRQIKVNEIHHITKIIVNKKGLRYAASTRASEDDFMSSPLERVVADRPFLFFIYNIISKNILLEGRLNQPELIAPHIAPIFSFSESVEIKTKI